VLDGQLTLGDVIEHESKLWLDSSMALGAV